jgi:hypothetical protein
MGRHRTLDARPSTVNTLYAGAICVPRADGDKKGVMRVVVVRVQPDFVMYEPLAGYGSRGGGAYCGPRAIERFVEYWEPVAQMRMEGALQLWRRERHHHRRTNYKVKEAQQMLEEAASIAGRRNWA